MSDATSSFGESNPALLKARKTSFGFTVDADAHVSDVLKMTSSVQLQKYGVLNNTFDPKTYEEVRPKVLLEILSSKTSTVLMSLLYVVFICCFIPDCFTIYTESQLVTQSNSGNPNTVSETPSSNLVYFCNNTYGVNSISVDNIIHFRLSVQQNNISSIRNWTGTDINTDVNCPIIKMGYEVNIWSCYNQNGCGDYPTVELNKKTGKASKIGFTDDNVFSIGSKSNKWQKYAAGTSYFGINYCLLENLGQFSFDLYYNDLISPQLQSRTKIESFGISVALFDNPYGLLIPVNQDVADSIKYTFSVTSRPSIPTGLYIFGRLLLLLCLFFCVILIFAYMAALFYAEPKVSAWVPEQQWVVLYVFFILLYINPIDIYGQLFVTSGWQAQSVANPILLTFIAYVTFTIGQCGFQFVWLLFADSLGYRTDNRLTYLAPKALLMMFIAGLIILVQTVSFENAEFIYTSLSTKTISRVFTLASLLAVILEFAWIVYWIFLIIRTESRFLKLPYMRTRQMQLSFKYFNRCALLYIPFLILEYVSILITVPTDAQNRVVNGNLYTDDVSLTNDLDSVFAINATLVGKAIFLTLLSFSATLLHLPAVLFADPDHKRMTSQIIAVGLLSENEKRSAAQSVVASYNQLNIFQMALLEGVAGSNKPFKFSIDLSTLLVNLSTESYVEKKSNEQKPMRRKSRAGLTKSREVSIGNSQHLGASAMSHANSFANKSGKESVGSLQEFHYDPPFEGDKAEFQFLKMLVDETTQTVCVIGRHKKTRRLVISFRGSCCEKNMESFNDKTPLPVDIFNLTPEASFPPRMVMANSAKFVNMSRQELLSSTTDAMSPKSGTSQVSNTVAKSASEDESVLPQHSIEMGSDLYSDTWKDQSAQEEAFLGMASLSKVTSQQDINAKSIELRGMRLGYRSNSVSGELSMVHPDPQFERLRRQSSAAEYEDEPFSPTGNKETVLETGERTIGQMKTDLLHLSLRFGEVFAQFLSTVAGFIAFLLLTTEKTIWNQIYKSPRFAPRVKLHTGFWRMYSSIRNELHELIRTELVLEPADVLVTGHCIGGALATICALDISVHSVAPINLFLNGTLSKAGQKLKHRRRSQFLVADNFIHVTMYSYGSPKVGNKEFARVYNLTVPDSFRVVVDGDIVTDYPTQKLRHIGTEVLVDGIDLTGSVVLNPMYFERNFSSRPTTNVQGHLIISYKKALFAAQEAYRYMAMKYKGKDWAPRLAMTSIKLPHVPERVVRPPQMSIVILVVGTRGDVQPFVYLGQRLQKDGHRVRLATHAEYRADVAKGGLEFFPLAGDPRKLSEYMVKTEGRLIPDLLNKEERQVLPEKMRMLKDITFSCYPACVEPDPEDPQLTPFRAHAIISNPVTMGHIHCAQAMSIPLHIMFPQPWSPTMEFPHPLSNLGFASDWSRTNYYSFAMVDEFMWLGLGSIVNGFRRKVLKISPLRFVNHPESILNTWEVPISHMWSPSFVPKCKDWPEYVDVVGEYRQMSTEVKPYTPAPELVTFLAAGPKPIYMGFGSMVIEDGAKLANMIKAAAATVNARVLLQSGWTKYGADYEMISEQVMVIGPMPHDYLFTQVCAVIHHGGAGTTSAGLRAGLPTFICPFFGDQFFWAEMVFRAKAGPKGCPVKLLSVETLIDSFNVLCDPDTIETAQDLGFKMREENGVENGTLSFYRQLPVEKMICDVSIFDGQKSKIAYCYCIDCELKMCEEVDRVLHRPTGGRQKHSRAVFKVKVWADEVRYSSFKTNTQGFASVDTDGKMKIVGSGAAEKLLRSRSRKAANLFAKSYRTLQLSDLASDSRTTFSKASSMKDIDMKTYCELAVKALDDDAITETSGDVPGNMSESVDENVDEDIEEIEHEEEGMDETAASDQESTPWISQLKGGYGDLTSASTTPKSRRDEEQETVTTLSERTFKEPEQLSEAEVAIELAYGKAVALLLTLRNLDIDISKDIPIAELPKLFVDPSDAVPYMELADRYGKIALSFTELGWILSEDFGEDDEVN